MLSSSDIITILVMAALLMMSAYFSATETAFSSLNKTRLRAMAEKGHKRAAVTLSLSNQYDRILSALLIGNNIVNISLSSIGTVFFIHHLGDIGATVSTVVITIVVLIFGEISPKSLAKDSPETFALTATPILRVVLILLTPLVALFSLWKKLLNKVCHVRDDQKMTSDELLILVDEAAESGSINDEENTLMHKVLAFSDLTAGDILTPRIALAGIPLDAPIEEIAALFAETRYSRILVYQDSIDHIIGVIHHKDFFNPNRKTQPTVSELMTAPIFAPAAMKINDLFRQLQHRKIHIAVITDEYGGTLGIVTMEDILEELVGDIWDEDDVIMEEILPIDAEHCHAQGTADLDDVCRLFDLEEPEEPQSVSALVLTQLGRIPDPGDTFDAFGLRVTVTEADERRVISVDIEKLPKQKSTDDTEGTAAGKQNETDS